jgi:hypothetical protein
MAGEEVEEKAADVLAPRCVKDIIEEKLFDRGRDLFTELSAVFMDTTSLSFYGEGGETLGKHDYSKDYRPDLKQMILGQGSLRIPPIRSNVNRYPIRDAVATGKGIYEAAA